MAGYDYVRTVPPKYIIVALTDARGHDKRRELGLTKEQVTIVNNQTDADAVILDPGVDAFAGIIDADGLDLTWT